MYRCVCLSKKSMSVRSDGQKAIQETNNKKMYYIFKN